MSPQIQSRGTHLWRVACRNSPSLPARRQRLTTALHMFHLVTKHAICVCRRRKYGRCNYRADRRHILETDGSSRVYNYAPLNTNIDPLFPEYSRDQ